MEDNMTLGDILQSAIDETAKNLETEAHDRAERRIIELTEALIRSHSELLSSHAGYKDGMTYRRNCRLLGY